MRRLVAIMAAALFTSVLVITAPPALAAGPPLSDYVVFGTTGVTIGHDSTVIGLVGDRFNSAVTNLGIRMNGNSNILSDSTTGAVGDARNGGNTRLDNSVEIQGTLTHPAGTFVNIGSGSTIGAEVVADPQLPALPAATAIPGGCPIAAAPQSGANGETRSPAAGSFNGDWSFGSQFTLNFNAPGNYYFNSITAGNGTVINAVPGVHVFVCDTMQFGGSVVQPNTLTPADFTVEVQGTDDHNAFRSGGGTQWIGDIFTPNGGGIHIGSGGSTGSVFGHLWSSGQVDLEHGLVVKAGPGHGNNGGGGGKDATLLHGAKNLNNGANNSLLVRYQTASVVGFDMTGVNLANVHHAILRLTVCNTPGDLNFCPDPPSQWPAAGGTDSAYRLDDGWERWGSGFPNPTNTPPEGNGNNYPIADNPHGSGEGVTWNCPIDHNIANLAMDCTSADFWNAGLKVQGPPTASTTTITNNMADGATVDFDVTADVQKGLGPLDTTFMTWFIRKPSGSGFVAYYSFQGAAAKGNPALAPQLILS